MPKHQPPLALWGRFVTGDADWRPLLTPKIMGGPSHRARLEPGTEIHCEECGVRSAAETHLNWLVCGYCGVHLQEHDPVDYDRVQLDEEGGLSGRGGRVRSGDRVSGSVIGSSSGKWGRLSRIDRGCGNRGPSRAKRECVSLIWRHAATDPQRDRALDLLDVGWPDLDGAGRRGGDIGSRGRGGDAPIWKAAHPRGVGASAAVCLHLASQRMGFDSKFADWVDLCLPGTRGAQSYGFRALKRMRVIMGRDGTRKSSDVVAREILARANLGGTIYRGISSRIWDEWTQLTRSGDNLQNHPRQVLAALCHHIANDKGLPTSQALIMDRFNVGRGYQTWISKLGFSN